MGISDEKRFFRQFFLKDPDVEQYKGEADPDLNPKGIDSYLVAYDWFTIANTKDDLYDMTGMTHVFFRQGPPKARLSYAEAQQKDASRQRKNGRQIVRHGMKDIVNGPKSTACTNSVV